MYKNNNTLTCFSLFTMVSVIVNCHLQGCSKSKNGGGGAQSKKKIYNFALCRGFGFSRGKFLNLSYSDMFPQ